MLSLERPTSPSCRPAPLAGRAEVNVVRDCDGRSVAIRAYATSPLRLLLPRNHGRAAWIYTSSYGGGLVDGDHLVLDMDIGSKAAAFISTQASTKVYRSTSTSSELHARVASDGLLVVAPDPVVCFTASHYRQVQQIDLAADAGLILVDWLSSGRHTTGERWNFEEYRARLCVRQGATLVVHDALALRAGDGDVAARLGRFDVLGIALLLGPRLRDHASATIRRVAETPVSRCADTLLAATPLGRDGCLLRFAGTSVENVGRMLRAVLAFVPHLLGDDPWTRKW